MRSTGSSRPAMAVAGSSVEPSASLTIMIKKFYTGPRRTDRSASECAISLGQIPPPLSASTTSAARPKTRPAPYRHLGMQNPFAIPALRETTVQCVDEAAEGRGFVRAVGQPDDGRSRVRQLNVVVLAVGGKPLKGFVGPDMEYSHQDALGLFDKAPGADGAGDGLAGGPVRFKLNCSGEVQDETIDEQQLPVTVQHTLPRRQDAAFAPACVEETVIIGEKPSATAHILKDFLARLPVVRMHVLHKNTHRGHHLAPAIAVDLV